MTKSVQLNSKAHQQQQSMLTDNNNNIAISSSSSSNNSKKKKKNKKKSKRSKSVDKTQTDLVDAMMNHHVQLDNSHRDISSNKNKNKSNEKNKKEDDTFWSSTNNTEERQKIREFWLQLGEEERRSLVKVEKEAVLRKMKEQQKHSCNCSVCGKKRTAIEDELEVLYDAYYEELEQYANHQQQTRDTVNTLHAGYLSSDPMYDHTYDDTDHLDEDDEDEDDEDDEDLDDDDLDDDLDDEDEDDEEDDEDDEDDYDDADDDDDDIMTRPPIASYAERSRFEEMAHIRHTALARASNNSDHFSFGNSLTVKGGILTVADDLLKNDGKKFLDMMERLAERRMQKEDTVSDQGNSYYQEEEDDDDDAYDDEDDEDTRTEEQRMEEGRRMFQIFAARMFEQRVLAAYREKVAQERQQRLLEELEEEDRLREEREAKKQKEREKKKDKKRQLKQQQEAERLARESKKKAEEEAAKREKAKKIELEKQKREQERLRREEEKRQKEEERLKREEERKRRAKEEKERAAEKERKRKEKEEKERLEKEKLLEKERLLKEKQEKDRLEKEKEEKIRLEKEKAQKALLEKERLKQEAAAAAAAAAAAKIAESSKSSPTESNTKTTSPPPGISPPKTEIRQQTVIDALVGSSRPMDNTPIRPPAHLQHPPFMPPMLQTSTSTSLLNNPSSPINDNSPSFMGIFNNRPLEPSASTRRSFAPISPIGQPLTGRRASSAVDDPLLAASNMIKRPSVTSPFDPNVSEPRSFFSSFLFGESRNNMIPDYDLRFPQQQNWTNGWTATSDVHGKLFGDALPDRTAMTLERAKIAYQKLNDITQTNIFRGTQHTLIQLHCMMNDLYGDFPVDIRELYETLVSSPTSGFQCVNHAQHGMIVLYNPSSSPPSPPLPPPFSPSHPLFG